MARKCPWVADSNRRRAIHGLAGTPSYRAWLDMRNRCFCKSNPRFKDYGGRGISICIRWNDFRIFLHDMGLRPNGKSLGRIDNDGHYTPENCRWESRSEQQRNRRTNRILTFRGLSWPVVQWAEHLGIKPETIHGRLRKGWPLKKVLHNGLYSHSTTRKHGG